MDFYWLYEDEDTLILMGYEQEIARLEWEQCCEIWELTSKFLDADMDMDSEFGQENVEEVQNAAISTLVEHCKEQIEWWNAQIELLEELGNKNRSLIRR